MKVEVAVLGSPFLISLMVSVDVKLHRKRQSENFAPIYFPDFRVVLTGFEWTLQAGRPALVTAEQQAAKQLDQLTHWHPSCCLH